jgi:hypothetical protein
LSGELIGSQGYGPLMSVPAHYDWQQVIIGGFDEGTHQMG